jgi:drug/metabolite transporter (DMT)-like permease
MNKGIAYALGAALLFGASTPFAKLLIGENAPVLVAGLLYAGSGIGLSAWLLLRQWTRPAGAPDSSLAAADLPWLAGAVLAGGIAGPVLLMTGLRYTTASSASLLLNMEGVLTALLAWFVFREQFDRRIFIGMLLIILAGVLLSWPGGTAGQTAGSAWGPICVVAACLCWAIDNNLTRKVSASDAVQIAAIKGLVAGVVNLSVALLWMKVSLPSSTGLSMAGMVGFAGYGLSLVLFVLALRDLGTARTGAYFSAAPFVGAAISLLMLGERPDILFWVAAALMLAGIWLHLTERHAHLHTHDALKHTHPHRHDGHHRHRHDFDWDGKEPHTHPHRHEVLTHTHAHFPDIHHRHTH